MKQLTFRTLFLLAATIIPAFADASPQIRQFPLDERTVYQIKVAKDQVTTVMFPGPLGALEAGNITADPQQPGGVLLSYQPGRYFFSLRALAAETSASLNVVWNRKTYVLSIKTDYEPFRSVTFYEITSAPRGSGAASGGPARLLALIDQAKLYPLLGEQNAGALPQIERDAPHERTLYRDFEVEVAEVYRFEAEDTLVFRLQIENRSEQEIAYLPQSLAVRVGQRVYPGTVADASGILPPGHRHPRTHVIEPGLSLVYLAISGSPDGGRNNLSVKNRFNIMVTRQSGSVTLAHP